MLEEASIPEIAPRMDAQTVAAGFTGLLRDGRRLNGGTEAANGFIELDRRIGRGFRNLDNYRLRMLLIGGGLTSPHLR